MITIFKIPLKQTKKITRSIMDDPNMLIEDKTEFKIEINSENDIFINLHGSINQPITASIYGGGFKSVYFGKGNFVNNFKYNKRASELAWRIAHKSTIGINGYCITGNCYLIFNTNDITLDTVEKLCVQSSPFTITNCNSFFIEQKGGYNIPIESWYENTLKIESFASHHELKIDLKYTGLQDFCTNFNIPYPDSNKMLVYIVGYGYRYKSGDIHCTPLEQNEKVTNFANRCRSSFKWSYCFLGDCRIFFPHNYFSVDMVEFMARSHGY